MTFDEALMRSARRLQLEGGSLLLAVSGGADSMALLHSMSRVAQRLTLQLEVGTVDHGLRPESTDDVAFVLNESARLGHPAHALKLELTPGSAIEARARAARYEALFALRSQRRLTWLLTAHTASDQAETVMMRLMRGSALAGSASIHASRADSVARPMLFATRGDVEQYLTALEKPWRHDMMNDDPRFQRVRVRQSLMPAIEALSPGSTRALARFAALAAEDEAHLHREAASALARLRWPDGSLDRVGLGALVPPIARRVMVLFLAEHALEIGADLVADTLAAVAGGHDATLPNDRVLRCVAGRVEVIAAPPRHIHGTSWSVNGR